LAEDVFETLLLTWIQSGPVGFEKHTVLKINVLTT